MVILAVMGISNRGKTTAIKLACEQFEKELTSRSIRFEKESIRDDDDICIVITVECKLRIIFSSSGDYGDHVASSLKIAREKGYDILVTATRTKGAPWVALAANRGDDCIIELPPVTASVNAVKDNPGLYGENFSNLSKLTATNILVALQHIIIAIKADCRVDISLTIPLI